MLYYFTFFKHLAYSKVKTVLYYYDLLRDLIAVILISDTSFRNNAENQPESQLKSV